MRKAAEHVSPRPYFASSIFYHFLLPFPLHPRTFPSLSLSPLPPPSLSPSLSCTASGLGGCIRGLSIQSDKTSPPVGQSVNLFLASRRSVRVYLDGCPTSESRYNCRGNDSVLVYSGKRTRAADYSLQPFTGNGHINASRGAAFTQKLSESTKARHSANTRCHRMTLFSLFSANIFFEIKELFKDLCFFSTKQ